MPTLTGILVISDVGLASRSCVVPIYIIARRKERACTRPFGMLTGRVLVLESSQLYKKYYNLVVCEV